MGSIRSSVDSAALNAWRGQLAATGWLAILVIAIMMLPQPVRAAFPGANGVIAYARYIPYEDAEIWLINPDGTEPHLIVPESGVGNFQPAWSPDGKRLVFTHGTCCWWDVWTVNADGTELKQLTNNGYSEGLASWSADGTEIVFFGGINGPADVLIMNADGSNLRNLTNSASSNDAAPVWSPTANRIAFYSDRDGNNEIYVMNADGTNPVRLTFNDADDSGPQWSPDGAKLVFHSNRDGNYEIYIMNADGSDPVRLTNDPASDTGPQWSPDGTMIAFTSDRTGTGQIFTMKTDGSDQRQLTTVGGAGVAQNAAWQPIPGPLLPPPVAFASFAAVATFALGPQADDDAFAVQATFTLGNGSTGIAPLTDPVHLHVGTLSLTIPAGSFHRAAHHGAFVFEGVIDGVQVRSTIFPPKGNGKKSQAYQFKASGEGANLIGTKLPINVGLSVGDDSGSTTLTEVTAQSPQ